MGERLEQVEGEKGRLLRELLYYGMWWSHYESDGGEGNRSGSLKHLPVQTLM